jgi:phosphoribosylanthranilate isomerase
MAMVKVKICGLTNLADAQAAVAAGADAVGFVFHEKSPRHIAVDDVAGIVAQLPPFVTTVGVFVNATVSTILDTARACHLDAIQLHGDESPEFCSLFPSLKVIKAFRVAQEVSLDGIERYATSAWLLDSFRPGQHGGTGSPFHWEWAQAAVRHGRPVILAGGLAPENVAEAVRLVNPFAVDVSSGIESAPGRKDHARMAAFILEARRGGGS